MRYPEARKNSSCDRHRAGWPSDSDAANHLASKARQISAERFSPPLAWLDHGKLIRKHSGHKLDGGTFP